MKRTVLIVGGVIALLAAALPARAQTSPELQAFQEAAGDRSALFRGPQAERYEYIANGHPYWSTREFKPGDIVFEGNSYVGIPLNIDAMAQRLLVQLSNGAFAISLTPDQVSSFEVEGHRFVGVGPGTKDLSEGFYEVFGPGPEHVYKRVNKQIAPNTHNVNGEAIGYEDPDYRDNLTSYYAISTSYYFRDRGGRVSRFRGREALIGKFGDRKREVRKAVRAARLDKSNISLDAYCELVLQIAASL